MKKKGKVSLQKIMQISGWTAMFACILTLMISSNDIRSRMLCNKLMINIDHGTGNYFIDKEEARKTLLSGADSILQQPRSSIDLQRLEEELESDYFINKAELYINAAGVLFVNIKQRQPLVRVINKAGVSYYIDKDGKKMPVSSKFTARVPVISGAEADTLEYDEKVTGHLDKLYVLMQYIEDHAFWKAQLQQLDINSNGEVIIIPRLGNHRIIFGKIENVPEKFNKLMLFYKEGLRQVGWYKYKEINLKYKDQVVCTKY